VRCRDALPLRKHLTDKTSAEAPALALLPPDPATSCTAILALAAAAAGGRGGGQGGIRQGRPISTEEATAAKVEAARKEGRLKELQEQFYRVEKMQEEKVSTAVDAACAKGVLR